MNKRRRDWLNEANPFLYAKKKPNIMLDLNLYYISTVIPKIANLFEEDLNVAIVFASVSNV